MPEQCRTSSSHSLGPSMELSLRVKLSYTIFEMRQEIGRSGRAKKLGPDVLHTVLTIVTVSVSDDEVHLLILRDFVHTLVKRDRVTWCITESVHQLII